MTAWIICASFVLGVSWLSPNCVEADQQFSVDVVDIVAYSILSDIKTQYDNATVLL